ncbi:ATP-binding protein [Alterinioella nitratireducens]|uniref:ATP-binding protein n=1 Tax=Alterinioella nitratireducens TaxID=2735915 RepID=UPI001553FEE3|nr:adenylate/guanylate cyclase domain-containing protein [Alterinioella nitratireducens]NPD20964.1 AAA family ATPase [Alterinioella nitratireducens]
MAGDTDDPQVGMPKKLHTQSELRLSTVMMVDMLASTEMSERLGPEASFLLLQDVLDVAQSVVAAHGGTIINDMGDGFFALFGAPTSIDRASLAACRSGLELCEAVRAKSWEYKARFGLAPQLRVGLAAGEVLITRRDTDGTIGASGNTINLAARLQSLADPNGVICSESVAIDTAGLANFRPLPPRELKGFAAPVPIFQLLEVISDGPSPPKGVGGNRGEFVGRAAELAQLMRWHSENYRRRPAGLIVGEAGIGKSRILGEFAARLGDRRLIVGACHPITTARPLAPLIEILRGYSGWHDGMSTEALQSSLAPILPSEPADRKVLLTLVAEKESSGSEAVSLDETALLRALTAGLISLGQDEGCLIAMEDLHWIDPLSLEVLRAVIQSAPAPFRILGTTRPVGWPERMPTDRIESIEAGSMQAADIWTIARSVVGEAADEKLVERVTRQSEGNPFFAIEILHHAANRAGEVEAGRIGAIQNIALARFDQLEPATKGLLRAASVQGRSFRRDVLGMVADHSDADLDRLLEAAEGLVEPDPADPRGTCRFRHILFRDSIYTTLPSSTRKTMHLSVAQALESVTGDRATGIADVLADHFEKADEPKRAVKYLREAARKAYGFYALESCLALMDRAFRLINADAAKFGQDELEDAVSMQLRCLDMMDRFRPVIEVSDTWLPRLRTDEGSPTLTLMLILTAKAHCHMSNFAESRQMATDALEMATRLGHQRTIAYAKIVLMRALSDSGLCEIEEVERLFEETRAFTEDLHDPAIYANRMFHMMAAYRSHGMLRRASEVNDEIEARGDPYSQTHIYLVGLWNRALNAVEANDSHTTISLAETGLAIAPANSEVRLIFEGLKLAAELALGIPGSLERRQAIHDDFLERGELTSRYATTIQIGFALFAHGRIWRGWRHLRRIEPMIAAKGHVETRRFFLLHRAELLLTITGDLKIDAPAPKLGLADIAMAIYLRMTGRRKAEALLGDLLSQFDQPKGLFVARAHTCLGLIFAAANKADPARESFDLAERLFRQEGLAAELERLSGIRASTGL